MPLKFDQFPAKKKEDPRTLEELCFLDSDTQATFEQLQKELRAHLASPDSPDITNAFKKLRTRHLSDLFKLTELKVTVIEPPEFKPRKKNNLIHNFCYEHDDLQAHWCGYLTRLNYLHEAPVDGTEAPSPFQILMGAFIQSELKKWKEAGQEFCEAAIELRDKACEHGMLDALKVRCEYNLKKLNDKELQLSDQRRQKIIQQVLDDAHQIGNRYWTPGLIDAADILLDLGSYLTQQEKIDTANRNFANQKQETGTYTGKGIFTKALTYLFMAETLADTPQSQAMIANIYQGKGLIEGTGNRFHSWAEARKVTIARYGISDCEIPAMTMCKPLLPTNIVIPTAPILARQ